MTEFLSKKIQEIQETEVHILDRFSVFISSFLTIIYGLAYVTLRLIENSSSLNSYFKSQYCNLISTSIASALGYTAGRNLTELAAELKNNTEYLLINSHSMKRILEILEFGSLTQSPILMGRVKSWPSGGVPISHLRTLSIPQILYDYNKGKEIAETKSNVHDLDELSQNDPKNFITRFLTYATHIRLAIHYEVTPISVEEFFCFDVTNSKTTLSKINLDSSLNIYKSQRNIKNIEQKNISLQPISTNASILFNMPQPTPRPDNLILINKDDRVSGEELRTDIERWRRTDHGIRSRL